MPTDNVMRVALGKHRYGDPSISGTFGWDCGRVVPFGCSWLDWAEGYENAPPEPKEYPSE